MAKRRVLICGATGFIGRNIALALSRRPDLEVHGVSYSRQPFDCAGVIWHSADLRLSADVARVVPGMDVIIQAAATTSGSRDIVERPYIHVTDNAVMNSLLMRQAFDNNVKHFIFFSCTIMLPSSDRPLSETDWDANVPMHPRYFASGWTKVYIERMCEFFASLGRTKHTVIRHTNIYGPHDKFDLERSHVFGATVTKTMTARDGRLVVWGNGEEARDLLFVDDLADFVECAIDRQKAGYGLYHCGAGQSVKIKNLARMIVAASGRQLAIEHDLAQPSIATNLTLDCRKAGQELGWTPTTSLDDGIERTLRWWASSNDAGASRS
jgi:nucleoside-diphosphate-sugar epimerase